MDHVDIGIVDTRKLIRAIRDQYKYDYKNYALTAFRQRVGRVLVNYHFKNVDDLIKKIVEDASFFEQFIKEISVETTEMFRNPSIWRYMRDKFFPANVKGHKKYKIWLANIQTGEELYSMMILLSEAGLLDQVECFASYDSDRNFEFIKDGIFKTKKTTVNEANYKRFNWFGELDKYFQVKDNMGYWDTSLIKNVVFSKQNITFDNSPGKFHLVWYRNQMIYYNQILQDQILKVIYDSLYPGGHLVIGEKETLENSSQSKKFSLTHDSEHIYKKI